VLLFLFFKYKIIITMYINISEYNFEAPD